jgi:hypothetical protein
MLISLTGEGDNYNRIHLMDGEHITDRGLRLWMWNLQVDHHPNNRTVTIILD